MPRVNDPEVPACFEQKVGLLVPCQPRPPEQTLQFPRDGPIGGGTYDTAGCRNHRATSKQQVTPSLTPHCECSALPAADATSHRPSPEPLCQQFSILSTEEKYAVVEPHENSTQGRDRMPERVRR